MNAPLPAGLALFAASGTLVALAAGAPEPQAFTATGAAPVAAAALQAPTAVTPTAEDEKGRHLDKLRPLSCFGCHSLDVYWDGRPPPADPTPAQAVAPATAATEDGTAVAEQDHDQQEDAPPAEPDADAEADPEPELPDPKRFAHGLHRAEGVGHCHQCHALAAHAKVTVRLDACRECH